MLPKSPYERLQPQTQEIIDSAIYVTEADRILNKRIFPDGREQYLGNTETLVEHLRELYANDIASGIGQYFGGIKADGTIAEGGQLVRTAVQLQHDICAASDGVPQLTDLVDELTNLPYFDPIQVNRSSRG